MSRVLIIEDEMEIAELEKDYLENAGFEVMIENRGDLGLIKVLREEVDIVVLDVMLPGMDGLLVCNEIRNAKDIPIILVSAKKEDEDKIKGLGFGADDYVTKPFSPSELVARVKAHLSRYNRLIGSNGIMRKQIIEINGIIVDPNSRKVEVDGEEKILTAREYDILMFFIKNPNKAFSKKELFAEVWGLDSYGDVSTVTVHINKLRDKIEKDAANPKFIETVWGVGYRFIM